METGNRNTSFASLICIGKIFVTYPVNISFDQPEHGALWNLSLKFSLNPIIFNRKLKIVKTQRNSTQLKATLKQLALELDIVVRCSTTTTTPPPQTFQPLLDQLES